jgi:hypothetical protein
MMRLLKRILPDHPVPMPILRGPFRGATVVMNPRASMRKALGLYEHELNAWLGAALGRVRRVIDVGANDGYFTFGALAAFRRRGVRGQVIAFEPQGHLARTLREQAEAARLSPEHVRIVEAFVGNQVDEGMTTLDALPGEDRGGSLVKIDVEGAEIDVIAGAASWLRPDNLFVIEVHREEYLDALTRTFADRGLTLRRIDQRPLPLLGREMRDVDNWWLVSEIPPGNGR